MTERNCGVTHSGMIQKLMQTQRITSLLLMLVVDHNKNIVIEISVLKWCVCVCVCACSYEIA